MGRKNQEGREAKITVSLGLRAESADGELNRAQASKEAVKLVQSAAEQTRAEITAPPRTLKKRKRKN